MYQPAKEPVVVEKRKRTLKRPLRLQTLEIRQLELHQRDIEEMRGKSDNLPSINDDGEYEKRMNSKTDEDRESVRAMV